MAEPNSRRQASRRLVIMCGIPGSGKTTVAAALAARLPRCMHIQTDAVRDMVARPQYTGGESAFVYATAMGVAAQALRARYDVILDGTFPREEFRREALARLRRHSSTQLIVQTVCDPRVALRRNRARDAVVPEESVLRILQSFEPPRGALVLDTEELGEEEAASAIQARLAQQALDGRATRAT